MIMVISMLNNIDCERKLVDKIAACKDTQLKTIFGNGYLGTNIREPNLRHYIEVFKKYVNSQVSPAINKRYDLCIIPSAYHRTRSMIHNKGEQPQNMELVSRSCNQNEISQMLSLLLVNAQAIWEEPENNKYYLAAPEKGNIMPTDAIVNKLDQTFAKSLDRVFKSIDPKTGRPFRAPRVNKKELSEFLVSAMWIFECPFEEPHDIQDSI